MTTKMMNMAAVQALADIHTGKMRLQAFEFAIQKMSLGTRTPHLSTAIQVISLELHHQLNGAHSQLFMWALALDGETKHTALRMAYKRFLREGMAIMNYLEPDGDSPFAYSGADYDDFRDELDTLKAEIEAEDNEEDTEW